MAYQVKRTTGIVLLHLIHVWNNSRILGEYLFKTWCVFCRERNSFDKKEHLCNILAL